MANDRVLKRILWAKSKPAMTWAEPPKMLRSKSADKSCIETVRKENKKKTWTKMRVSVTKQT